MFAITNVYLSKVNKLVTTIALIICCSCLAFGQRNKYSEDLSVVRPTYATKKDSISAIDTVNVTAEAPSHTQNELAEKKLEELKEVYGGYEETPGYRVQIYSGSNHEEANNARKKAYVILRDYHKARKIKAYPEPNIYIDYEAPLFRVKVGDYVEKPRAYRIYELLKRDFSNALLVPDHVDLDKID